MEKYQLLLVLLSPFLLILLLYFLYYHFHTKWLQTRKPDSLETGDFTKDEVETEDLVIFQGGENLTVHDILDAPGEVVGKSGYGTLYRARFTRTGTVMLLRFVRPACVGRSREVVPAVRMVGVVRHANLVPLHALYVGPRGEKLFVHPFYSGGNLAEFLKDGKPESHRWEVIYKISIGITKGLDHLHTGLQKPIVHGNLKSKNILLDSDHQPCVSDFGMHLILNPTAAQEMLEATATQGYKAPELIKMKDASIESDIYSLGVIFLEILTRSEPVDLHLPASLKNLFLEHKISEMYSSEVINQSTNQNSSTSREGLLKLFQLAMACCSPSPVLRPDSKHVIRKLEEIAR